MDVAVDRGQEKRYCRLSQYESDGWHRRANRCIGSFLHIVLDLIPDQAQSVYDTSLVLLW